MQAALIALGVPSSTGCKAVLLKAPHALSGGLRDIQVGQSQTPS